MSTGTPVSGGGAAGGAERPPGMIRNAISLIGVALAVVCVANILFLIFIDYLHPSPYIGIFAYMILPAGLILGLLLIPIGLLLERRRRRRMAPGVVPRYPRIDLNQRAQRSAFAFFVSFSALFVVLSALGSYRAYEFTDSVQFCGQLCHTVMNPEYTTYLNSPHARVACVDCHVGPGAGWYVRSKLSGAYQVYAATFNKFPRPIPTPVANLRPAQQTCEQCHWPSKFYGAQLRVFTHYASDEKNTPRQIRMLVNIGGVQPVVGQAAGIHWHMNIANRITYVASDAQRQVIPWVQMTDRSGRQVTYLDKDSSLTPEQIQKAPKRLMDCIDCHDRPSHIFTPPDSSVDQALQSRHIDPSLPSIKQQAVTVLSAKYATTDEATRAIARDIDAFYSSKYPQVYSAQQTSIRAAIAELQAIYRSTMFPEMKVDWRTHPNNIGHFYFPGCFRCHDGQHASADGSVIRKDCAVCHTVIGEATSGLSLMGSVQGIAFQHPVDIGDLMQVNCSDCHTGGTGP